MKLFVVFVSSLVLASASTYIPSPQRLRRDVSELNTAYLIPGTELEPPIESQPQEAQDAVVLAEDGYKYKTLRTLRTRRDVSHLNLAYLPPATPTAKPHSKPSIEYLPPVEINGLSNEYLPPVVATEPPKPSNEYLPPVAVIKEAEVVTEAPLPSNEYLPPVVVTEAPQPSKEYLPPVAEVKEAEVVTEPQQPSNEYLPPAAEIVTEPQPQAPSNEYLPPTKSGEDISEVPFETLPKAQEVYEIESKAPAVPEESSGEVVEAPTEIPQDTAVLAVDGYHYKVPDHTPELFPVITPTTEYLPPLEEGLVEAEGPVNGESAVLEQDGYHYRSIKRRF